MYIKVGDGTRSRRNISLPLALCFPYFNFEKRLTRPRGIYYNSVFVTQRWNTFPPNVAYIDINYLFKFLLSDDRIANGDRLQNRRVDLVWDLRFKMAAIRCRRRGDFLSATMNDFFVFCLLVFFVLVHTLRCGGSTADYTLTFASRPVEVQNI